MHKVIIGAAILFGLSVISPSQPMAANEPGDLPAPGFISCDPSSAEGAVCFEWGEVEGAVKYSVDIEVPADIDGDNLFDMIVELSFGTGDRTDGLAMEDPTLCVPFSELYYEYDLNGDGVIDETEVSIPLTGTASVKVKALGPGKGKGRQNNSFTTEPCTFIIPSPAAVLP